MAGIEEEDFVARRTKTAEGKIALAEAQALADVRAAAANAAVTAASAILSQSVQGSVADDLLIKGIAEVKAKRNLALDMLTKNKDLLDRAMRAEAEVERLRSENNRINKLREAEINQAGAAERVYLEAMMVKDARIKELEADRIAYRNLGSRIEDLETYIEQLEAAFLEAESGREYLDSVIDAFNIDEDRLKQSYREEQKAISESMAHEALERIKER